MVLDAAYLYLSCLSVNAARRRGRIGKGMEPLALRPQDIPVGGLKKKTTKEVKKCGGKKQAPPFRSATSELLKAAHV